MALVTNYNEHKYTKTTKSICLICYWIGDDRIMQQQTTFLLSDPSSVAYINQILWPPSKLFMHAWSNNNWILLCIILKDLLFLPNIIDCLKINMYVPKDSNAYTYRYRVVWHIAILMFGHIRAWKMNTYIYLWCFFFSLLFWSP